MSRGMQVLIAAPAIFGALWDAEQSGQRGKIDAAIRDLESQYPVPIVGAPYTYEDEGMVGAEELIGADEIVGNEDDLVQEIVAGYPIVGAGKPLPSRMQVVQRQPDRRRILMCPFGPTVLTAGSSSNIQAQPQDLFRPDRLVVPSDLAFFFAFTEFKVGQKSALTVAGEIPCAAFTEPAWGIKILADTAQVGNIITITVKNIDTVTRTFRSVLIGNAAV